eukprot:scaffold599_cov130-Isochrysis_galbana.AAC.10
MAMAAIVTSQPSSQAFAGSIPSRQSGMIQPVVQEMFATVHAAGSSLFVGDRAAGLVGLVSQVEPETIAKCTKRFSAREDASSVWAATMKEREKGLVHGPFSAVDLDARFGEGQWRAIRRFGVWQKGKCRACDNCAESGHK